MYKCNKHDSPLFIKQFIVCDRCESEEAKENENMKVAIKLLAKDLAQLRSGKMSAEEIEEAYMEMAEGAIATGIVHIMTKV